MKGAICGLVASALVLSAGARVARAEKPKKVVVEQFSGTGADKFKRIVVSELGKQGIEVVSDKKRAATEAELGLLNVSDNYPAVAKELGVGAFIDGTVTGSKHMTARLKVKGPDGAGLGGGSWTGANEHKLLATVDGGVGKKLAAIFSGGAAAKEEAAPVAAEEKAAAKEEAAEEAPKPKKSKKVAKADDEEKPAAKSDEAEATVAESAEPPSRASGAPTIDLAVGAHVYGRTFSYNQSVAGGQQAYHLAAVPAPALSLDYFFLPFLGLTVNAEYSVALISQDNAGAKYRTNSMGYGIGAKGRTLLGSTELTGVVGYQDYSFKISPFGDDPNPPQVAAVDYKQLRVGAGIRIPLGPSAAFVAGADYLHLLGLGELRDVYFPAATGRGGEGYGGVAFSLPWATGMEARLTADFRRYAFAMNSIQSDLKDYHRLAGGATDQYIGANISLGLRR